MNVLANKKFVEEMQQKKQEVLSRGKPPVIQASEDKITRAQMTAEEKKADNKRHREEKKLKKLKMMEESRKKQAGILLNPETSGVREKDVELDY